MIRTTALVLLFVTCRGFSAENSSTSLARHLLAEANCTQGVCCVLNSGNGNLPVAVALNSGCTVFALDEKPANIALTRDYARQSALLGSRVYADLGSPSAIPLTSDYADLLLITDMDDETLARMPALEIIRVLSPALGKAIIGRATGMDGKGKLSRAAIEEWAKSNGIEGLSIKEDKNGLFATIQKRKNPGSDNWSFWQHGMDNNPVSQDKAWTFPDALQWLGRPFGSGGQPNKGGFILAAGGRYFATYLRTTGLNPNSTIETGGDRLYAYQGYNGRLLWSWPLPNWTNRFALFSYYTWIATDDYFYLADGCDMVALHAATGKEAYRIEMGSKQQQIWWLGVANGTAYALLGKKPVEGGKIGFGDQLVAFDLNQRARLWEHTEPAPIEGRGVVVNSDRMYFCAPATRLAALDLKSGEVFWSNKQLALSNSEPISRPNLAKTDLRALLYFANQVLVVVTNDTIAAFSSEDGHQFWTRSGRIGGTPSLLLLDKRVVSHAIAGAPSADLLTGALDPRSAGSGCGRTIAAAGLFINHFGSTREIDAPVVHVTNSDHKPTCDTGYIVANGMRYSGPVACGCEFAFRGVMAYNSGSEATALKPEFPTETIDDSAPPEVNGSPTDWTQYRRDVQHSGSSAAAIGNEALVELWHFDPERTLVTTQVAAVGDFFIQGGSDGVVRCLDANTGKSRWSFATGGRIFFTPTISLSRVYVGCSDGYVYCLGAATGKLLWRFRAAPADKRMFIYDDLMSRWPVNTNIVVEGGVVYASAGIKDTEGVYVHALDSCTGKLKWSNTSLGNLLPGERMGMNPMGAMTIAGNRLWLKTDRGYPAALDLGTGMLHEVPEHLRSNKPGGFRLVTGDAVLGECNAGKDIGVMADKYIVEGGRRLYWEQQIRGGVKQNMVFALEVDEKGNARYPRIGLTDKTKPTMPVWDKTMLVCPTHVFGRDHILSARAMESVLQTLDDARITIDNLKLSKERPSKTDWNRLMGRGYNLPARPHLWEVRGHHINAMALCRDALLIVEGTPPEPAPEPTRFTAWELTALERDTGKELWRTKLPSQPIYDGVSVDRQGRIIVVFEDGGVSCFGRRSTRE